MSAVETAFVLIDRIRIDGGTQPREEIDLEQVAEYAEQMAAGAKFPAIVVYWDGANYWLADGFHRYHAARKNKATGIMADIWNGTQREAVLHSVGANATHGKRRSRADVQRAIDRLLNDGEWGQWSDNFIAEKVGCSQPTVSARRKLSTNKVYKSDERKGRDGRITNTGNIGRPAGEITQKQAAEVVADRLAAKAGEIDWNAIDPAKAYIVRFHPAPRKWSICLPPFEDYQMADAYRQRNLHEEFFKLFSSAIYIGKALIEDGTDYNPSKYEGFDTLPNLPAQLEEKAASKAVPYAGGKLAADKWYVVDTANRKIYNKEFEDSPAARGGNMELKARLGAAAGPFTWYTGRTILGGPMAQYRIEYQWPADKTGAEGMIDPDKFYIRRVKDNGVYVEEYPDYNATAQAISKLIEVTGEMRTAYRPASGDDVLRMVNLTLLVDAVPGSKGDASVIGLEPEDLADEDEPDDEMGDTREFEAGTGVVVRDQVDTFAVGDKVRVAGSDVIGEITEIDAPHRRLRVRRPNPTGGYMTHWVSSVALHHVDPDDDGEEQIISTLGDPDEEMPEPREAQEEDGENWESFTRFQAMVVATVGNDAIRELRDWVNRYEAARPVVVTRCYGLIEELQALATEFEAQSKGI